MNKPFATEYGYLVKDLKTGGIDNESFYPKCKAYTERKDQELVEGYAWVRVKLEYTEA